MFGEPDHGSSSGGLKSGFKAAGHDITKAYLAARQRIHGRRFRWTKPFLC